MQAINAPCIRSLLMVSPQHFGSAIAVSIRESFACPSDERVSDEASRRRQIPAIRSLAKVSNNRTLGGAIWRARY